MKNLLRLLLILGLLARGGVRRCIRAKPTSSSSSRTTSGDRCRVYGSKYYETPNVDRLASQGMKFTNYHNCQNCTPERAAR